MNRKILLLEDNPLHRLLLADELEDSDYDIRNAKSIEEARDILTDFTPDLFIFDVVLGGHKLDVIHWVRDEIRASEKLAEVPVLFVTAYRKMDEHVKEIQHARLLNKPFTFEQVEQEIKSILKESQQRK